MSTFHSFNNVNINKASSRSKPYCKCRDLVNSFYIQLPNSCTCGEERNVYEWAWDDNITSPSINLGLNNREVHFHPSYSSGTAAIRGNVPFIPGYTYYWEIKILTTLYGTDVMVGVGTSRVNLQKSPLHFCSLLGSDSDSWGYSYQGSIHHKGQKQPYGPEYGLGSIVGVYLDMWEGTLEFYLNRKPLGCAFTSLHGHTLYPMLCSTARRSVMRVIYSHSCPSSLQFLCLKKIGTNSKLVKAARQMPLIRILMDREFFWLYSPKRKAKDAESNIEDMENNPFEQDSGNDSDSDSDKSDSYDQLASFCKKVWGKMASEQCLLGSTSTERIGPVKQELKELISEQVNSCTVCNRPLNDRCNGESSRENRILCNACDFIV